MTSIKWDAQTNPVINVIHYQKAVKQINVMQEINQLKKGQNPVKLLTQDQIFLMYFIHGL